MTNFYESDAWQGLRYRTLRKHGRKCMSCGAINVEFHVDHIKPRSKYPELELDPNNLQVLCRSCNRGKSNKFEDDFRPSAPSSPRRLPKKEIPIFTLKDDIIVKGILRGGVYCAMAEEARDYLPCGFLPKDIADSPVAQMIIDKIVYEKCTFDSLFEHLDSTQFEHVVNIAVDGPLINENDFRVAVQRGIHKCWTFFSQELKSRQRDAELKEDEGLRSRLTSEFITAKRHMKELESQMAWE